MKTFFYASAAAFVLLLNGSAWAASKGEDAAAFRLKVASCRAQAKDTGVKATTSAFYTYMAGCIDKVQVTWAITEEKAK